MSSKISRLRPWELRLWWQMQMAAYYHLYVSLAWCFVFSTCKLSCPMRTDYLLCIHLLDPLLPQYSLSTHLIFRLVDGIGENIQSQYCKMMINQWILEYSSPSGDMAHWTWSRHGVAEYGAHCVGGLGQLRRGIGIASFQIGTSPSKLWFTMVHRWYNREKVAWYGMIQDNNQINNG